jgi:hypothetical protein
MSLPDSFNSTKIKLTLNEKNFTPVGKGKAVQEAPSSYESK